MPSGRREQAQEADIGRAALLELVDRGDRGIAGGEHRVDHDHQALVDVFRALK